MTSAKNDDAEEWRPIPGWEGLYEASNQGRVRSLERLVRSPGPRGLTERRVPSRILTPTVGGQGSFNLYRDGKRQTISAHRIHSVTFDSL